MSDPIAESFFFAGGTLPINAPSYIERQADASLLSSLLRSEYCYILTSRQMGKSSLMARTASRLRTAGTTVAVLDLTSIGQEIGREQWYYSLLMSIGQRLGLKDKLRSFWRDESHLGPVQRWTEALQHLLGLLGEQRLVIFIDEIDTVLALPFRTDEFFAAIRACYNRRAEDPDFGRLAFCLLGVADPSDLIDDTRLTPFNVGRRIELSDFTPEECSAFERGLGREEILDQALVERVYYWTGGHPYLTQRLCQAIVESPEAMSPVQVDELCETLFLSSRAQEQNDNLTFVRDRLLKSQEKDTDLTSLLDLYRQVYRGRRVLDDKSHRLVTVLRLAGIVRSAEGCLKVRNRIYARVFNPSWIAAHIPGAELRRQRAAFRRGALRVAALSGVILAIVSSLAIFAFIEAGRAEMEKRRAERLLYASDINLAQQALNENSVGFAQQLLDAQRPQPGQMEDMRGFEWRYLWRISHEEMLTFGGHTKLVCSVAFSPDRKILASGSFDGTIKLWNVAARRERATLHANKGWILSVAFSPDGKWLASAGQDATIRLWNPDNGREIATLDEHTSQIYSIAFSPDSKTLASGGEDSIVRLWDIATRTKLKVLTGHKSRVCSVAFSPDGRTLASGSDDETIGLWDVATGRAFAYLKHQSSIACAVAFSPDGKRLASGSNDNTIRLWDVAARRVIGILGGHTHRVDSVAFSPDGKRLASGSWDSTVRLWDANSRKELITLRGHADLVNCVTFSPDGKTLASGSNDNTVKLWNVEPSAIDAEQDTVTLRGDPGIYPAIAISPNGKTLASGNIDKAVILWDIAKQHRIRRLAGSLSSAQSIAFSPDSNVIAIGSNDKSIRLWDVATGRKLASWKGHTRSIFSIAFSPDGRLLASGDGDNRVGLWDVAAGRNVATLPGHTGRVFSVAFSPDSKLLASGSDDNTVRLWDVAGRKQLAVLDAHSNTVLCVAFSPNSRFLVAGNWDRTIKIWDVATRHERPALRGHTQEVRSVAFSPDGKTLASSSKDGTVRLWNVSTWQQIAIFRAPGRSASPVPVDSVCFSHDGNTLAAGYEDGAIWLWRAGEPNPPAPFPEDFGPKAEDGKGEL